MKRLLKFLALPAADRRLLMEAAFFLGASRIGLHLLPFRTLCRLLERAQCSSSGSFRMQRLAPNRITWAVNLMAPYVLGARPCLPQALAAQVLLLRRGVPARLRVGVARGAWGEVRAHAWIETGGKVVIGGSPRELARYTPLLAMDAQIR
jgi:Transglutaminase-like superfamily